MHHRIRVNDAAVAYDKRNDSPWPILKCVSMCWLSILHQFATIPSQSIQLRLYHYEEKIVNQRQSYGIQNRNVYGQMCNREITFTT